MSQYLFRRLLEPGPDFSVGLLRALVFVLATRFPATIKLTFGAILIASSVGILTGVVAAVRQNSWFDGISMFVALFGFSMPIFWLGIMLILVFAWLLCGV